MSLSIDDLFTAVTAEQTLETFISMLEALNVPASKWRKGGVYRTILKVVASSYAGFSTFIAALNKAGFRETSTGDFLTLLARYVYKIDRLPATYATEKLTLTNTGGGVYPMAAGGIRALWTVSPGVKKAFVSTEPVTLNPGDQKDVQFQAVEVGSGSSAPAGTITELETNMPGVTVTNPRDFLGSDAEKDTDLQQRCLDKLGTLSSRGPRSAYSFAISSALRIDGSPIGVNRIQTSPSSSTGVVNLWVATPGGVPSSGDLAIILDNIEQIARPTCVTVILNAATVIASNQNLTIWAKRTDGLAEADIAALVTTALAKVNSDYPIGGIPKPPSTVGKLWATFIEGTAKDAHASIFAIDGASDVTLADGQIVSLTANVTVRVVDVP